MLKIFQDQKSLPGQDAFLQVSLELFRFQYRNNPVYRAYVDASKVDPSRVRSLEQIPFLPIQFFKTHSVKTTAFNPEIVFESSGTTGMVPSTHPVKELALYRKSFHSGFELFYGDPGPKCIIGLLPSYLERTHSSLVFMVNELIGRSLDSRSGFYLDDYEALYRLLNELEESGQSTLLIGVSFALMDFAERYALPLRHTIVMETGGMKGRRKEITREALHGFLESRWNLSSVHSEYGMTELLSQAYSKGRGMFLPVPWMKTLIRAEDDPYQVMTMGSGILNVIDLANVYSCAFIATEDTGNLHEDGRFEVTGRVDASDLRGCSLLVT